MSKENQNKFITFENACKILTILSAINDLKQARFCFTQLIKKEIIKSLNLDQVKVFANNLGTFVSTYGWSAVKDLILNLTYPVFTQENILINCYVAKVLIVLNYNVNKLTIN